MKGNRLYEKAEEMRTANLNHKHNVFKKDSMYGVGDKHTRELSDDETALHGKDPIGDEDTKYGSNVGSKSTETIKGDIDMRAENLNHEYNIYKLDDDKQYGDKFTSDVYFGDMV